MALTKITTSLVAVNSLTSANIADNSIDATKIANNQILARHIAAGSISDQLAAAQPTITSLGTLTGLTMGGDITKGSGEFKIKNTANGENVGIYTTSSSSELHALKIHSGGNVEVLNGSLVVGNASGATITMNDTDTSQEDFAFVLGANALAMRKGSNSNDIMRLDLTNERVGIGTTSPAVPLDVRGNVNITADDARLLIEEADGTDITWVGDITGAGVGGCFLYNHGGTATVQLRADATNSFINNGSNFGIGTASPNAPLTVAGEVKFKTTVPESEENRFLFQVGGSGNNGVLYIYNNAATEKIKLNTGGDSYLNGGNVGIQETAPEALLEVDGTIVHGNIRNDTNATRTYTNGNALNAGVIEFTTSISGSDEYNCVITWAKGSWTAFSYEFTYAAASFARKLAGGGYHNNSGGTISGHQIEDLYGLSQESDLAISGTNQTIVFTIQVPNGTHPMVHAKFMIGGSANPEASDFTVEWVAR
tara:strand:+ start:601 stop:2043 length:1443 start_codon:yes stop_codon:yes gene_type:complete